MVSGEIVFDLLFDLVVEVVMGYIEFVKWVDFILVVFVISNILVKMVMGIVDDLLIIFLLVIFVKVVVVFVMN